MGSSFCCGGWQELISLPSEPAWSLGPSSQNWLSDSSFIQPGPTRLCPNAYSLNWASKKRNSPPCWLWIALRFGAWNQSVWCSGHRGCNRVGGKRGRGLVKEEAAKGARCRKWSKAEWREMLQSISNLIQQWWAEQAFLSSVPGG